MSKSLRSRLVELERGACPAEARGLFIVSDEVLESAEARRALMLEHNLLAAVFLPQKEVQYE